MNKKWNESISHSARLHDAHYTFSGNGKILQNIADEIKVEMACRRDYWGIKNRELQVEVKVPSGGCDSLAIPHGRPGVARQEGWLI